ncbi:unnamed protein product [Pichia kudriavzevii]
MFGYMMFKGQRDSHKTPDEFQRRARQDIETHLKRLRNNDHMHPVDEMDIDSIDTKPVTISHRSSSPLVRPLNDRLQNQQINSGISQHNLQNQYNHHNQGSLDNQNFERPINAYAPKLTYGSSPLRQTVTSNFESSDECSSIDSGKSGCSLTHESAQQLLQQQQESLDRMLSRTSTLESSLFRNDLNSLYTSTTNTTINTDHTFINSANFKYNTLNDLRSLLIYSEPKPEWNNKIPEILSPYPNIQFRIQIIPNYCSDNQITELLAHSDIYKESKFDLDYKIKTAKFIVERARLRHKQILIDSFGVDPLAFNSETNLVNDIRYDCYFKFEWRNIIENYMLNIGIEYQCRSEFKLRINKLKKLTQEKKFNGLSDKNPKSSKMDLYKNVLLQNKSTISEEEKMSIWKDVQNEVYRKLDMDDWNSSVR